jgi:hypothetical protein
MNMWSRTDFTASYKITNTVSFTLVTVYITSVAPNVYIENHYKFRPHTSSSGGKVKKKKGKVVPVTGREGPWGVRDRGSHIF